MKKIFAAIIFLLFAASCNRDELITEERYAPTVELDSQTGIYVTKIGKQIIITPTYTNASGASFLWLMDGKTISESASLTYTFTEHGDYYISIEVSNSEGSDREELKVEVSELAPPVISLAVPPEGLEVAAGRRYTLTPDVQNGEDAAYLWTLDGEEAGTEKDYTFCESETGEYLLKLRVENEDGNDEKQLVVTVLDALPVRVFLPAASLCASENVLSVSLGRILYIDPYVVNATNPEYRWEVDGEVVDGATDRAFEFSPESEGKYIVKLSVTDRSGAAGAVSPNVADTGIGEASLVLEVECFGAESTHRRYADGSSSPAWNKVYEYMPAPGQFINELVTGGFAGEATHDAAIAYAERRLTENTFVSLGAYGGYIIVGFDHSIDEKGGHDGYDFSIKGNQFTGSSEPGIVWVMQDTNGNGRPDDEWFELKGSEWDNPATLSRYAVTYYRPAGTGMSVQWTDNREGSGEVDYIGAFHRQDFYYPQWIESDTYTYNGTRLESRISQHSVTNEWSFGDYGWGYADNFGSDSHEDDGNPEAGPSKIYFKISNAVYPNGVPAELQYIDFIKVQTGVVGKGGRIGEVSTEVIGFTDENI